ncbi:phosphoglycerate mutase family protein [Oricola indica]|uniref:phosphoglycerate mutase family protein n=1 Tax=Oricola indica TaxID=2872591 RepID=UPI003CCC36F9
MNSRMLAIGILAALLSAMPASAQEKVFVIRHADKETGKPDPALTDAGRERASNWAEFLINAGIDVVINTDARRSRETGEIIAQSLDAERDEVPVTDLAALMDLMTFDYSEQTVLVVAHTETIPGILGNMGVSETIELAEDDYANLFLVAKPGGNDVTFVHLRMP